MSKGWKGRFMTEEELREKLAKLEESRMLQEEKVNGITDSMNRLRERAGKENKKLADIDSEIARFEGRLYKKILLKNGIENFDDFENVLKELYGDKPDKNKKQNEKESETFDDTSRM